VSLRAAAVADRLRGRCKLEVDLRLQRLVISDLIKSLFGECQG